MLAARRERRVIPDLRVGTSVGALTADALDGLARLWRRVRHKDIFSLKPSGACWP
jgi:hypothetical protein